MNVRSRFRNAFAALIMIVGTMMTPAHADPIPASSIPDVDLMQPTEVAALLKSAGTKPLILQVGFKKLYDQAHIPGSEYAAPAGDSDGLNLLRERVAKLSKGAPILIYCGCCPWSHCPNLGTAYQELHTLGFKHVKALHIAENFGKDWVDKGYPTIHGA